LNIRLPRIPKQKKKSPIGRYPPPKIDYARIDGEFEEARRACESASPASDTLRRGAPA
jgi:hypothetical protein